MEPRGSGSFVLPHKNSTKGSGQYRVGETCSKRGTPPFFLLVTEVGLEDDDLLMLFLLIQRMSALGVYSTQEGSAQPRVSSCFSGEITSDGAKFGTIVPHYGIGVEQRRLD